MIKYIEDRMLMELFSGENFGKKVVNFKVKLDFKNLNEINSSFKALWVILPNLTVCQMQQSSIELKEPSL